jgi:hypothetical protein
MKVENIVEISANLCQQSQLRTEAHFKSEWDSNLRFQEWLVRMYAG